MAITSVRVLNKKDPIELVLELYSFAGGTNTLGTDQELKNNEARVNENWEAVSAGGMERTKGFNEVADGGVTYTDAFDMLIHHNESGSTALYGIIEGDLVIKSGANINQEDAAAFTTGVLSHAVSAGDALWITNSTDNLQRKTIGGAIAAATDQPTNARERIYAVPTRRLMAEGGGVTVYGSRTGTGNWNSADTWSESGDAWNIDFPNTTKGAVPGFPGNNDVLVFTEFKAYRLFSQPNVEYNEIPNGIGCWAPYSIAKSKYGVFFVSNYPTLGVFLYDGVQFIELTEFDRFIEDVDLTKRMFGVFRDNKYYFFYNESGSGVSYPNRLKVYDGRFGRWMARPVHDSLSDNFGYPVLLQHDNNELYVGSSANDKLYELETDDNSDEGYNTEANYTTKYFTSRDMKIATGGGFPKDEVRIKLTKLVVEYYGTTGNLTIQWTMDRGKHSGSQTITMDADGDKLNDSFTVNTSKLVTLPPSKTVVRTFSNSAVGERVQLQILNNATGERPQVRKIRLHAVTLDEV